MSTLFSLLKKVLTSPPDVVAARAKMYVARIADRRGGLFRLETDPRRMLKDLRADSVETLWEQLAQIPYVAAIEPIGSPHEDLPVRDRERILAAAERALESRVDLLGSGDVWLGDSIDWQRDYKSGRVWPLHFSHDLDYAELEFQSDVKFPWEVSRLQWLIPAAQAYRLTGDDRYAAKVRAVLESWMSGNPVNVGVNWACTMEAALRILTWTCLFHFCGDSASWRETAFQRRFLACLWSHGRFTDRYLEISAVNGNHCTADAAGLVFAGLFFGQRGRACRWLKRGWNMLVRELPRQVSEDGVDFEGSIPYHRLVTELFLLPALYREANGLPTPAPYRRQVVAMARFTEAYCRADGSTPLLGDGDDARALPLGTQDLGDHRYLPAIVHAAWGLLDFAGGGPESAAEVYWLFGSHKLREMQDRSRPTGAPSSRVFPAGGYYVLRNSEDHVFVDCAPVGLAGRGGHGHNDCLSFEASLCRRPLVVECGSYVYTASAVERNKFRSTAYHNTPAIDREELNRFLSPNNLWALRYDAVPQVVEWHAGTHRDVLTASHAGYCRLEAPVTVVRTFELDHDRHELFIRDEFRGQGRHAVTVPLHLHPGVRVLKCARGSVVLAAGEQEFALTWENAADWEFTVGAGEYAPRYGVKQPIVRLLWQRDGELVPLALGIRPVGCVAPRRIALTTDRDVEARRRGCGPLVVRAASGAES